MPRLCIRCTHSRSPPATSDALSSRAIGRLRKILNRKIYCPEISVDSVTHLHINGHLDNGSNDSLLSLYLLNENFSAKLEWWMHCKHTYPILLIIIGCLLFPNFPKMGNLTLCLEQRMDPGVKTTVQSQCRYICSSASQSQLADAGKSLHPSISNG